MANAITTLRLPCNTSAHTSCRCTSGTTKSVECCIRILPASLIPRLLKASLETFAIPSSVDISSPLHLSNLARYHICSFPSKLIHATSDIHSVSMYSSQRKKNVPFYHLNIFMLLFLYSILFYFCQRTRHNPANILFTVFINAFPVYVTLESLSVFSDINRDCRLYNIPLQSPPPFPTCIDCYLRLPRLSLFNFIITPLSLSIVVLSLCKLINRLFVFCFECRFRELM